MKYFLSRLSQRQLIRLYSLLLAIVLILIIITSGPLGQAASTEILWDTYGVPHISSNRTPDLFRAFGWAQMQSHANLLLRLYGQARGRAAEYWGEDYAESDQWVRKMGIPERSQAWYKAQTPKFRQYLDTFAAGINAYAKAHPDQIEDDLKAVLPISPVDVLAHTQRVLHFTFVVNPEELQATLAKADPGEPVGGSNGWAIAPSHSASGKAMLLANPHLPWADLFLWYEAQITALGIDAYGATLVGVPVLAIAFNDAMGWTHTVNTYDGWDAYALTSRDGGYEFDGQVRPFDTETQTLKVKQKDGSWQEQTLTIQRSVHGPVVAEPKGQAIALRVSGLDRARGLEQWWKMACATNLSEFETALKRMQLPMFTVLYADRDGHILNFFNGQVPVRQEGTFADWSGVIPGNTSKTLWTRIHAYEDLPRVVDPKTGWLQNANDAPWTTTLPAALNPDDFPAYIAPRDVLYFRAQRSLRMLMEDPKISFEELIRYKHSTRMELADRILDDLTTAAKSSTDPLIKQAIAVLQKWDRQAEAKSRGAVLFKAWNDLMDRSKLFAIPWDEKSPLTTPDGLADPEAAITALKTAATELLKNYGALDIAWGDVFRLKSEANNLPANGGPGGLGIFRTVNYTPAEEGQFQAIDGDSFVAVIEFSNPVRAQALTSYGNATQPDMLQGSDQLTLMSQKKLRPVWRSRRDILAHLKSRTVNFGKD
ncbi:MULTISPECIES: acylase [Trichocoleus]|uniref:Acylase n=1 Tax=Trichocoleus desertorum GB2-A4 TaxID=2933944 RepID=A0ABV0JBP9_9CYAN|nr:acylase [Trichocoleus sp. FACHB-46]MBD1865337.1 acylase [Trichocoleus sp. FACHB-46]